MEIKRRRVFKKSLAWLLAVAMVIGIIPSIAKPMHVHAAGTWNIYVNNESTPSFKNIGELPQGLNVFNPLFKGTGWGSAYYISSAEIISKSSDSIVLESNNFMKNVYDGGWATIKVYCDKDSKEATVTLRFEAAHTHTWEKKYNDTKHWQECSGCHEKKDEADHSYGTSSTYYTCSCGYVNTSRKTNYDNADAVRTKINNLPSPPSSVTLDNQAAISEARAAYNALNPTETGLIESATLKKLTDCEDYYAVRVVEKTINDLPAKEEATAEQITEARNAYESLTPTQKGYVNATILKKLTDTEDYYAAKLVRDKINALPALEDITSASGTAISEARAAYNALTDVRQGLVGEEAVNKLTDSEDYYAAAVVREQITALPTEITADNLADARTAIAAARSAYDALNETRQGIVGEEAYDKLADLETDVVEFMINALPEAGKIKTTDKAAIDAARAAYEALPTQAQKDEFPEDVLQKLIDAESELEARFVEKAIDNLPDAYDVASTDAAEINAVSADYNALSDEQKEMIDEELRDKLAEVEKKLNARLVEDVIKALPTKRNVKNTDKADIEAAREAYDALSDEEKAMVDPDLVSRLIADEEEVIKKMLDALPEDTTTPEYAEQVEAIKKAYDELSDEQKEDLGEDIADEINDANDKVQEAKVKALIDAVEPITGDADDMTRINAAKNAYNALTDKQKAELEAERQQAMGDDYKDVLSELEDAEKKHEEEQVKNLIDAIPTPIDSTDAATKKAIDDAREAYDALSPEQKANVDNAKDGSGENYNEVLKDAEKDFVKDMVSNITRPDSASQSQKELDDIKEAIDAAKEAYDALTDEEKEDLAADPATDPAKALDELNDKYAEETVKEKVSAITEPDADAQDTAELDKIKDAIDAAQDAYDKLTDKQKEDLAKDATTDPAKKLEALEDKYEEEAVKDMIKNIPDMSGDMTDEEIKDAKEAIDAAREAYDALSDEQKAHVDAAKDPTTGENYDDMLEEAEVDVVEKMIEALPDDISTADKEAIDEAREAYEKLSPDQKAAVDKDDLDKLEEAEEKYAEEKDKEDTAAANAVTSAINKLPSADNVKLSDKDAIEAARKAYNSLTADQKKKVSAATLKKLTDAEAALKKLQDEANKKDDSDKKKDEYKEEWHDGQWYDKDGKATYKPKGEWKKNSTGWWYEDTAGWYPKSQWQKIDGKWYYFDASGYMAANEWVDGYWLSSDGSWTYEPRGSWKLNSTGWWYEDTAGWYPKNQWQKIDGKWYYFNSDGYMASNQNIGQWRVGSDGAWVE